MKPETQKAIKILSYGLQAEMRNPLALERSLLVPGLVIDLTEATLEVLDWYGHCRITYKDEDDGIST